MSSATIKLFLAFGDPKRLRTAELSNWSGKAVAAPRSDLEALLKRDEMACPGVYILTGHDPETDALVAYVGEAESLRTRIQQHRGKDFWNHAFAFFSKDENLTKAHVRYLENRLIQVSLATGRYQLANIMASGSHLPESDREDMEVFLEKVQQLLPVLGTDLLTPVGGSRVREPSAHLVCEIKGLIARGARTPDGFVVFQGSQAVPELRPSARDKGVFAVRKREELLADGALVRKNNHLLFTRDVEFASPSGAVSVIRGGNSNGLKNWRTPAGVPLGELEEATTGVTAGIVPS
jgi:hypothetical protein